MGDKLQNDILIRTMKNTIDLRGGW